MGCRVWRNNSQAQAQPTYEVLCCRFLQGRCWNGISCTQGSHNWLAKVMKCSFGHSCRCGHWQLGLSASEVIPPDAEAPILPKDEVQKPPIELEDCVGTWKFCRGDKGGEVLVSVPNFGRPGRFKFLQVELRPENAEPIPLRLAILDDGEIVCGRFTLDVSLSTASRLVFLGNREGIKHQTTVWERKEVHETEDGSPSNVPDVVEPEVLNSLIERLSTTRGTAVSTLNKAVRWSALYEGHHGSLLSFLRERPSIFQVTVDGLSVRLATFGRGSRFLRPVRAQHQETETQASPVIEQRPTETPVPEFTEELTSRKHNKIRHYYGESFAVGHQGHGT